MSDVTRKIRDQTWEEFETGTDSSIVFYPVGSIEQHGPHLPLRTDSIIADEFATRVATQTDGLVAPSFQYGYRSQPKTGGGEDFPGTMGLRAETIQNLIRDTVSSLSRDGVERIVFVPGHGENEFPIREGIDLYLENGGSTEFMIAAWWNLLSDEIKETVFSDIEGGFPGWPAEHAGVIETSLILHFRPELVRRDRISDDQANRSPAYSMKPAPEDFVPDSGSFYKASHASAKIGKRVSENVVETLVHGIKKEWSI